MSSRTLGEEWCEGRMLLRQGGFVKSGEVVSVKKKVEGSLVRQQTLGLDGRSQTGQYYLITHKWKPLANTK